MWLIAAHWLGDFVLQSDRMAKWKATMWSMLFQHVVIYTVTMTVALIVGHFILVGPIMMLEQAAKFAAVTFVAHFITDAITSRINASLWSQQRTHDFFVSVGFDQLLHMAQIYFTLKWVFSNWSIPNVLGFFIF